MPGFSATEITVFYALFSSVAEEMGVVLRRSAFSPNIKERQDFSCALFDGEGRLLAQAAHIPVHLGALPDTVAEIRRLFELHPGDVIITNDPYRGGTHLPDLTLVKPVFVEGRLAFFLAVRAHHADVGGRYPGSMALSRHIEEEGVLIPPTRLVEAGRFRRDFWEDFLSRVRGREEREGDLRAQLAALERGEKRLLALVSRYGLSELLSRGEELQRYSENYMREVLREIPRGRYYFEDYLDDDGEGGPPVPIRLTLTVEDGRVVLDFRDSAPELETGLNAVRSVTRAAVFYVFLSLAGGLVPPNQGALAPLEVLTRPGTVVDARPPAPVAGGNVETSQRIVDVILGALAQAVPERIPAASCGSMNNVAFGGEDFAYYETIGGGMGGRAGAPGLSGVHTHMTNTLNTPVEALELGYPLVVERYGLRPRSGGGGRFRGGDGLVRRFRFLAPVTVSLLTERRKLSPYGLFGGKPGKRGRNLLFDRNGRKRVLPGKGVFDLKPGEVLEIRTPGGGGYGRRD
ncbi:hydantoinase B/oxoprolinase family protein [Thermosulfurimonas sp. F29]|uniref:hydantoinase B/oxoprolinase family protein n=1 Tax=Thermosulfurimonas sp. F29 TaxID=2867247 RepID=UPI001C82D3E4|nr:hydantoinase B/oxoprolinase family protein [Thermosulfurimonas sp. F29]MBX6422762.1 hydantoinase B/oxoprolinase family protein [Thermosulfurimonas sp. F29]